MKPSRGTQNSVRGDERSTVAFVSIGSREHLPRILKVSSPSITYPLSQSHFKHFFITNAASSNLFHMIYDREKITIRIFILLGPAFQVMAYTLLKPKIVMSQSPQSRTGTYNIPYIHYCYM